MSEQLSLRRLALLLRNDTLAGYRSLAIVAATLAVLLVFGSLIGGLNGGGFRTYYDGCFIAALFACGLIGTSLSFRELHDKHRNASYLLLPASALEKTLARLAFGTVGAIAFALLLVTVVAPLAEALNLAVFGVQNRLFQPFGWLPLTMIGHYVVVQSAFFVGAAWFRKAHFIKTALTLHLVLACFAGLAALLVWLLSLKFETTAYGVDLDPLNDLFQAAWRPIYYVALPLFFWLVAWMRVKEAQVSHGV
ncbi:MAG TPA: hypothetical protein VFX89_14590 [Gammaproteobacteria bacterium]|nr:hypothetical protein [Gammaproteobacteria bacterium]